MSPDQSGREATGCSDACQGTWPAEPGQPQRPFHVSRCPNRPDQPGRMTTCKINPLGVCLTAVAYPQWHTCPDQVGRQTTRSTTDEETP